VRYLQAFPDLIPSARFDKSPSKILEIGAGLGAGGLGAALLAKQMSKSAHVCITDCDPLAVQVIEAAIRCNGLAPSYPAVATDEICTSSANEGPDSGAKAPPVPARHSRGAPSNGVDASASVLDWDQIHSFTQASGGAKYDVILGAEVVHEMSHAAGVHRAIRELMAPGGCTIMVCGAAKHRWVHARASLCDALGARARRTPLAPVRSHTIRPVQVWRERVPRPSAQRQAFGPQPAGCARILDARPGVAQG
jgi:hypothetical protein